MKEELGGKRQEARKEAPDPKALGQLEDVNIKAVIKRYRGKGVKLISTSSNFHIFPLFFEFGFGTTVCSKSPGSAVSSVRVQYQICRRLFAPIILNRPRPPRVRPASAHPLQLNFMI